MFMIKVKLKLLLGKTTFYECLLPFRPSARLIMERFSITLVVNGRRYMVNFKVTFGDFSRFCVKRKTLALAMNKRTLSCYEQDSFSLLFFFADYLKIIGEVS